MKYFLAIAVGVLLWIPSASDAAEDLFNVALEAEDSFDQTAAIVVLVNQSSAAERDKVGAIWQTLIHRRLNEVKGHLNKPRIIRLRKHREELNAKRREALALIFDVSKYISDPETGKKGEEAQPAVDQKVLAVRKIWEKRLPPARLNADYERDLALLDFTVRIGFRLPGKYTKSSMEKLELNYFRALMDRTLSARAFGLDWQEQLQIDYCEAVEKHNKKILKASRKMTIGTVAELEQLRLLNEYRTVMGVHPLIFDVRMNEAARKHSVVMKVRNTLSHRFDDHPVGIAPSDRIKGTGFPARMTGENIARGYATPQKVSLGWYNSAGHHRNMLDPRWTHVGAGEDSRWWTQAFGSAKIKVAQRNTLDLKPHRKKLEDARLRLLRASSDPTRGSLR